jgi:hypothetical protein
MNRTTTTTRHRTPFRAVPALPAVVTLVVAVSLSGCSGSPGAGSSGSAGSGSGAAAAWGSCMRHAGFDIEDPSEAEWSTGVDRAPEDVDQDAFRQASAECRGDDAPRASDEQKTEWTQELRDFAACMREHGLDDFPEPDANGALDFGEYGDEPLRSSPAVAKADEECHERYLADWGGK